MLRSLFGTLRSDRRLYRKTGTLECHISEWSIGSLREWSEISILATFLEVLSKLLVCAIQCRPSHLFLASGTEHCSACMRACTHFWLHIERLAYNWEGTYFKPYQRLAQLSFQGFFTAVKRRFLRWRSSVAFIPVSRGKGFPMAVLSVSCEECTQLSILAERESAWYCPVESTGLVSFTLTLFFFVSNACLFALLGHR